MLENLSFTDTISQIVLGRGKTRASNSVNDSAECSTLSKGDFLKLYCEMKTTGRPKQTHQQFMNNLDFCSWYFKQKASSKKGL